MELVQCRIVTDDVAGIAGFYNWLIDTDAHLNDYYVEVPTPAASVGFSKCRFTEEQGPSSSSECSANRRVRAGELILDFAVDDVDAEYERIGAMGVEWVLPPTTQPWGTRSMLFRDPEGHLVNVFSRKNVSEVTS
jgi:catechol 2,3-dioxygenase-like lactoylglutathione lyase family enzyme